MKRAVVAITKEVGHQYNMGYYADGSAGGRRSRRVKVSVNADEAKVRTRERCVIDQTGSN